MKKRILAFLLSLTVVMTLLPAQFAFAYSYSDSRADVKYPANNARPRVMFNSSDIPAIRANLTASDNAAAKEYMDSVLADPSFDAVPSTVTVDGTNTGKYDHGIEGKIEIFAFDYAINGNVSSGQTAVSKLLTYLNNVTYNSSYGLTYRTAGATIFHASEVFDWCYPLLTDSQKSTLISKISSIAQNYFDVYSGGNFTGQGAIVGHGSENQILRDLLAFGIATYGDCGRNDIYTSIMGRITAEYVPVRNEVYQSGTVIQGSEYGWYRFYWDMYAEKLAEAFLRPKYADFTLFNTEDMQNVYYSEIYSRLPDGRFFTEGDVKNISGNYQNFNRQTAKFAAGLFHNADFNGEYRRMVGTEGSLAGGNNVFASNSNYRDQRSFNAVQWLIMNDPTIGYTRDNASLQAKADTTLPPSKYFGAPIGKIYARNKFGFVSSDSSVPTSLYVAAEMKIGERYAANHDHGDAGTFQLYYRGLLTGDYNAEDDYGKDHPFDTNYYKRTIAHNGLTIYDSSESFSLDYGAASNDGGQLTANEPNANSAANFAEWQTKPVFDRARVINHSVSKDNVSYIKGDITRAYNTSKAGSVARSMVFAPTDNGHAPAILYVFDKVTSKTSSQTKKFLLHTAAEPTISGNTLTYDNTTKPSYQYDGRLTMTTLLPASATYTKVAGKKVGSKTYTPERRTEAGYNPEWGRVEIQAATEGTTTTFLNVLIPSDTGTTPAAATLIGDDSSAIVGAKTEFGQVALFANTGVGSLTDAATFTIPGEETDLDILMFGIGEGKWVMQKAGGEAVVYTVDGTEGTIAFEGDAGTYTLRKYTKADYDATVACHFDVRANDGMGYDDAATEWVNLKEGGENLQLTLDANTSWSEDGLVVTGTGNAIELPSSVKDAINGDEYTIEFATTELTQGNELNCVSILGNVKNNFAIYKISNANKVYFKLPGTKSFIRRQFQTTSAVKNHHNVITVDKNAGKMKWYIDGVQVCSMGYSTKTPTGAISLISELGNTVSYKQIKIMNIAIPAEDVVTEYNNYLNPEF